MPDLIPECWKKFLDELYKDAEEALKNGQVISPTLFALHGGKLRILELDPLIEKRGKEVVPFLMEQLIEEDSIEVVIFVSEMWMLELPMKGTSRKEVLSITPSEHPDRTEGVLFNVLTKTNQYIAKATICRNPVKLYDLEVLPTQGMEGKMVHQHRPVVH